MNNKGQCGRDFPAAKDFQLPTASSILSSNVSAMEAPEDINSDHDIDTEHESSLSEVINCSFFKNYKQHTRTLVMRVDFYVFILSVINIKSHICLLL